MSAHLLTTGSHLKQGLVGRVAVKGTPAELACVCLVCVRVEVKGKRQWPQKRYDVIESYQ
jgi:hypothetical protein